MPARLGPNGNGLAELRIPSSNRTGWWSRLANAEAYRRDRRKDVPLQENEYHALRFLCEDVGKRLDEVLDAIIRVLFPSMYAAANREREELGWNNSTESQPMLPG